MGLAFGNLLNRAMAIIPPTPVVYKKFLGNVVSSNGISKPTYSEPITIENASVQPVKKLAYQELGLDLQKEYRTVFVPANIVSLEGQLSSDIFIFEGRTWKAFGNTSWYSYDGWNELIVVGEKTR